MLKTEDEMRGDYKYEMQMRAEEIAEQESGCDFYALPQAKQHEVYSRAIEDWTNSAISAAEEADEAGQ